MLLQSDRTKLVRIRYWLPGIPTDRQIVSNQLVSCSQAGFGGVELAFLGQGIGKPDLDDQVKWGGEDGSTRDFLKFVVAEGKRQAYISSYHGSSVDVF